MSKSTRTIGRPSVFADRSILVHTLTHLDTTSRYLKLQLVAKGYVKVVVIHTCFKGRPHHDYILTGKAKGYLALARNWGRKTENLIRFVREDVEQALAA